MTPYFLVFASFLALTWPSNIFANTLEEQQELNYAKALRAYNYRRYKRALQILGRNVDYRKFHPNTYLLIADIHGKKKDFKKAIRVYLYLIKKAGYIQIINEKDEYNGNPPPADVLGLVRLLADNTFALLKSKKVEFEKDNKIGYKRYQRLLEKLYRSTKKYYDLCYKYKFRRPLILYQLGLLEKEQGKLILARDTFLKATKQLRELKKDALREKDPLEEDEDFFQTVNAEIGDILLTQSEVDIARTYYYEMANSNADKTLKEMGSLYLQSLSGENLNTTIGLTSGNETNPGFLTSSEISDNDAASTKSGGIYLEKEVGIGLTEAIKNRQTFAYWLSFYEKTFNDTDLTTNDSRQFLASLSWLYFLSQRKIITVSATGSMSFSKNETGGEFADYSKNGQLDLKYKQVYSASVLEYGIPITTTRYDDGGATIMGYGASMSYTHIPISTWLTPAIDIEYISSGAADEIAAVDSLSFSLSNRFNYYSTWEATLSIYYAINTSTDPYSDTKERSFSLTMPFALDILVSGLSLTVMASNTHIQRGDTGETENTMKSTSYSANLSYSF